MEQWREIPGYESIYEASTDGRIRSCDGKVTRSARFDHRVWKQRIIKPKFQHRKNTDKVDARVTLWKDGKEKTHLVARLVALAWCTGYFDGATVNHIDGNPLNNKPENLEWVSLAVNIRHGFTTGLYPMKSCTLINPEGEKFEFQSQAEASRFLNRNQKYISYRVKSGKATAISADGSIYGYVGG